MSDEDALLAAICADPADDTARLAFADLLDEHGGEVEAAWARFIRAHTRLVGDVEVAGDVTTVLDYAADAWVNQFAARLGIPLADVTVGEWARGFPEAVAGRYTALRARWDDLLPRVPFCQLRVLETDDAAVEDIVMWPQLERLTALDLTTWDGTGTVVAFHPPPNSGVLGERGVAALASCPELSGLKSLSLALLDATDRVADLLLNSRYLRRLRDLRIDTAEPWTATTYRAAARLEGRFGSVLYGGSYH